MTTPSRTGPAVLPPPHRTPPPPSRTPTASSRQGWKCGVCGTKVGDLVCSDCVGREAERRREKRASRLRTLSAVRGAAGAAVQDRQGVLDQGARLEREADEESSLKESIRHVMQRVAEERIRVASADFALKHQRDILSATGLRVAREQASAAEIKEALLKGLRLHLEDARETLRQRRWRKVVQLFVLFPVEPSLPSAAVGHPGRQGGGGGGGEVDSRGVGQEDVAENAKDRGSMPMAKGMAGASGRAEAVVRGVSKILDLPLPNNGDYSHMPADVVMAVLISVARLVVGVARYLGVHLPHPLFPAASMNYAAIAVDSSSRERRLHGSTVKSTKYPLCPLSKLAEIGVTGGASSSVYNAVGAFETALDLLRSDVVHLCVEGAGVPVDKLWPAEAILLNLWELQQHAISELRRSSPMVDVPLPLPRDPSSEFDKGMRQATSEPAQSIHGGNGSHLSQHAIARAGFSMRSVGSGGQGGSRLGSTRAGAYGLDRWSNLSRLEAAIAASVPGGLGGRREANDGTLAEQAEDEENTYEFVVDDGIGEGEVAQPDGREQSGRRSDGGDGSRTPGAGIPGNRYAERMRSWGSRLAAAGGASLGPW